MSEKRSPRASDTDEKSTSPKRWWQWMLVYPGLAIAVVGAVPTYLEAFESYRLGVPFGRSIDAQEQNRLWQDNFDCAQKANFSTTVNKRKVEISSTVCESGDVLLRGKRPEWDRPQLRWVSWNEVAPNVAAEKKAQAMPSFFGEAHAGEAGKAVPAQAPTHVLCQRWKGQGQLLQRIGTPQGCVDQIVNTYNGWVVSSRPVPCNPTC